MGFVENPTALFLIHLLKQLQFLPGVLDIFEFDAE